MAQRTIRQSLRENTAAAHERLDRQVGALDLAVREDYARFLSIQLAARVPIERWIAEIAPALAPPSQAALLRADLDDLGIAAPADGAGFAPGSADGALGVAWVLAGSHLGNRMMLRRIEARASAEWPRRFLADPAMPRHWKGLLAELDRPADATTALAVEAAVAAFEVFLGAAQAELAEVAA